MSCVFVASMELFVLGVDNNIPAVELFSMSPSCLLVSVLFELWYVLFCCRVRCMDVVRFLEVLVAVLCFVCFDGTVCGWLCVDRFSIAAGG